MIEIRWKRKRLSRSLQLDELMRQPRAFKKITAELLRTPAFSTANDWKKYDCDKTEHLFIFLVAACSAGAPASSAADSTYASAYVLTGVTSHVKGLLAHQGTRVRPSGLLPSRRVRLTGSFMAGMPAEENALYK